MKKVILMAMFLCLSVFLNAQQFYPVSTTSTKLGYYKSGDLVFLVSTGVLYQLDVNTSPYATMTWVLADAGRYTEIGRIVLASGSSYYLDTANAQTAHGTKGFFDAVNMYSTLGVSGTITLPGSTTLAKTSGNGNSVTTSGSLVVGGNDTLTTTVVDATTANITDIVAPAAGSISNAGRSYFDSTLYIGNDNTDTWLEWVTQQMGAGGVRSRINMANMADYSIQDKAGTGQVLVIQRDTTGSTAKANLAAIKLATTDSIHVNRVVVSDTLQGLVLTNSAGTKYRLRVSPTGVLTLVAVP